MRPFVRLLLRYGITHTDLTAVLRRVYVEVALEDFKLPGKKQSDARISVLTGLSRKEVKKVRAKDVSEDTDLLVKRNRASWAVSAWSRDKAFVTKDGKPMALSLDGSGKVNFNDLVQKYCGDVPVRAVLDELIRVGAVQIDADNFVSPTADTYLPKDTDELLRVAFQNVADHISTIDYNDQNRPRSSRLELAVTYDNVTESGTEAFRALSREKSKSLLVYLDKFLAIHDADVNPNVNPDTEEREGTRTGLGIYYFEDRSKDE